MILIIAYGNNLREDDGAGLLLADRLASTWQALGTTAELSAVQQLVPELAADIAGDAVSAVVFVDTRVSTSTADRDVVAEPAEPASQGSPSMGHHVQPAVMLAYAQALDTARPLPPAWLVTVPGYTFGYGEGLSDGAQAAIRIAFEDSNSPLNGLIAALAAST